MKIDRQWCEDLFDRVGAKGPMPKDYVAVCYAFHWVRHNIDDYREFIEKHVIKPHREYLNTHCLFGFMPYNLICHIWDKPRGYSGDGDLLQKMYDCFELPDGHPYSKTKWDHFICGNPEFLALQHRKTMFREQLDQMIDAGATSFVDLGCGNGWYTEYAWERFVYTGVPFGTVVGIDHDFPPTRTGPLWVKANVLKKLPSYQCDIVYCGGLFDYFSDGIFSRMLERIKQFEPKFMMIGNLDQSPSAQSMMDCLDWRIFDRTRWNLLELAIPIFNEGWDLRVETDPTGHQHFLVGVQNESMLS